MGVPVNSQLLMGGDWRRIEKSAMGPRGPQWVPSTKTQRVPASNSFSVAPGPPI